MSIFNILSEQLYTGESGFDEMERLLENEILEYGEFFTEAKKDLTDVPKDFKLESSSNNGTVHTYTVTAKPTNTGEDNPASRDYHMKVILSWYCANGDMNIIFKEESKGLSTLHTTNPRAIMYGVAYSIHKTIQDYVDCDINSFSFMPWSNPGDSEDEHERGYNMRSKLYQFFANMFIPIMGRTVDHIDPPGGITPPGSRKNVVMYLVPKGNELIEAITGRDIEKVKELIANGEKPNSKSLVYAIMSKDIDMVKLIAKHTHVKKEHFIVASEKAPELVKPLLKMAGNDFDFEGAMWSVIKSDNVDNVKAVIDAGHIPLTQEHINTAIESKANNVAKFLIPKGGDLKKSLATAMRYHNLDIVKFIIESGYKITPDIVKVHTSKPIKAYLARVMWNKKKD